jgi:hypothetical protein
MSFVPGVELAARLYREGVAPVLSRHRPGLAHSAALFGAGSEVLGFDTARSTDHDWGPRLQLFVASGDVGLADLLARELPGSVAGYSTNLVRVGERRHLRPAAGPVEHGVEIVALADWLVGRLGFDPLAGVSTVDWLATPTQVLAEVTGGVVIHDGLGTLHAARRALAWYPDDLWRYVLACQWQRVSQEEAFVGRCVEVGDALGAAVVAARLVRDLMRLCLLMDRQYPPYSKWVGSAFARLPCADRLGPVLTAAVTGQADQLPVAYELVAELHNDLGLTAPVDPSVRDFHERPYRVLHAERFAAALMADSSVQGLPLTGAIDQVVDSTDVLTRPDLCRRLMHTLVGYAPVADTP